jgi:predicted CXXCH cytochrome family protein
MTGWGTTQAQCLTCHDDSVSWANATALFQAAHDGQIGECNTCHEIAGETIHGTWGDTTAACARCHRTHTAAADGLLIMDEDELCEFCHGPAGVGLAATNVMEGVLRNSDDSVHSSLRGGGFEDATMNTDTNVPVSDADPEVDDEWAYPTSSASSATVTSTHSIGVSSLIWGSGPIANETAPSAGETWTDLHCVSCHDPHIFGETYRMLKSQPADSVIDYRGSSDFAYVTDQLIYAEVNPTSDVLAYDTADYASVRYVSPDVYTWNATTSAWELVMVGYPYHGYTYEVKYSQQLAEWCAACHERIHDVKNGFEGTGSTDSGDAIYTFRHKTGANMTAYNASSTCGYTDECHGIPSREGYGAALSCLGCHVAHGTSAAMNAYAQIPWPGEDATTYDGLPGTSVDADLMASADWPWDAELADRSSLLRLDNRGVCQNAYCHPKGYEGQYTAGHVQGQDY